MKTEEREAVIKLADDLNLVLQGHNLEHINIAIMILINQVSSTIEEKENRDAFLSFIEDVTRKIRIGETP
jgi:hypothetical protein